MIFIIYNLNLGTNYYIPQNVITSYSFSKYRESYDSKNRFILPINR